MLKYFCDKCEKEIKDGDIHRVELPRRVVSKVSSREGKVISTFTIPQQSDAVLCTECYKELLVFTIPANEVEC